MDNETDNSKFYKFSEQGIKKRNIELYNKVILYFNSLNLNYDIPFKQKLYLYENLINDIPKCHCGKFTNFIDMINGFRTSCSKKCAINDPLMKERRRNTCFEKWGVDNPSKLDSSKEKVKKTNLERFGVEYPLMSNDIKEKNKKIFVEKYGVDNPSKIKSVREKAENTMLKKFGVRHAMLSDDIKQKNKEYFIDKYGVDNPYKVREFREKAKMTMLKRWGVESPLKNKEILDRLKKTNLEKWGYECVLKSTDVRNKISNTNMERFGVDNPIKNIEIRDKIIKNNIERFGVDNPFKLIEVQERIKNNHYSKSDDYRIGGYKISSSDNYIKYLGDGVSLFKCDCGHDHTFEVNSDFYSHRVSSNLPTCVICYPKNTNSIKEEQLYEFISSIYSGDIIRNYRDGKEIDIYLPELYLGFEFNGLYWHSEIYKDKSYHLDKTNFFKEKGIRIIHIWEDDWVYKSEIIKSQIRNWIGITENKLWARRLDIREIFSNKEVRKFLNDNHIQGYVNSNIRIGLYQGDDLVSLMIFDRKEGRNIMSLGEWNLSRFCNKLNTNVVGGASKILNYFKNKYKPSRIISYSDKDWSDGDLYYKLGFNKVLDIKPDYKYIIDSKRKHKSVFKKSNLGIKGDFITEKDYTNKIGLNRIWSCGRIKFELKIDFII